MQILKKKKKKMASATIGNFSFSLIQLCLLFLFGKCSAGTGLLSMMAARAMNCGEPTSANTKERVTACESYLPMVKLMRKVLHLNNMGRNINVINKRSDELKVGVDIPTRADVLVRFKVIILNLHVYISVDLDI